MNETGKASRLTSEKVGGPARPGHYSSTLLEKRDLSERYFLMVMSRPRGFEEPGAGTFIHLLVPGGSRFFLRRPFSILDCDASSISLIIVEKGEGTRILRRTPEGTELDFIGPLGTSFPRLPGRRILAAGGGVGLAPLYRFGVRDAGMRSGEFRLLYGARTRQDLFLDEFEWGIQDVEFATDDGSYGSSGNVVDLARRELQRSAADVIFSCGPTPMLKEIAGLARAMRIPHYVSLENRMACGMGACRSCVVPIRREAHASYRTVCNDGPVFDGDAIIWEDLPDV